MSAEFSRDHCKIAVAKVLQTIGWHSINTTPLEVLTDIMSSYIGQLAKVTNDYANEFGQTEPNLDHLGLAFQEMGVNLGDLEEYVTYVNFLPAAHPVPKYPLPKESNLNFLKPGSKEVVTRPVYVNEHLPPMYPLLEEQSELLPDNPPIKESNEPGGLENDSHQFKKPADLSPEFKRVKREDEGGRPTREISSVMMTTSGFLSPAREGKLPEAKAPAPPPEPPKPPSPPPPGPPVPELVLVKKKPEKKRDKVMKEAIKSANEEKPPKKINNMKDILKRAKSAAANAAPSMLPPGFCRPAFQSVPPPPAHFMSQSQFSGDMKLPPLISHGSKAHIVKPSSLNKVLAAAKAKTEKLNTTITAIPVKAEPKYQIPMHHAVDKLVTEPDRQKINILRKISNVKEKHEKAKQSHLAQQAQDIVSKINLSSDITIEPINPSARANFMGKSEPYFDDGSPPGTPPTPRTPEILTHSPAPFVAKEKRKRKAKPERMPRPKKPRKQPAIPHHHFMDADAMDMSIGRPKTPDANLRFRKNAQFPMSMAPNPSMPFPFPLSKFGGPGLIPPLTFPFASTMPDFANPYFPAMLAKPEPMPKVSPKPKEVVKAEPPEAVSVAPPMPDPTPTPLTQPIKIEEESANAPLELVVKKSKEHKKDKKDKAKKKSKKEKGKDKSEKKKLKEAKKEKVKVKKEKKKKVPKQEPGVEHPEVPAIPKILLKVNSPSPRPETPDSSKKLNIKPIVKKEDVSPERKPRETSPGLAQISALVIGPPKPKNPTVTPSPEKPAPEAPASTVVSPSRPPGRPRIHPLKPKPTPKPKKVEQPFLKRDAEGNEVWICPACGQQDDGRPMIGCDGCDAWYHWVCVGIQVPPDENENWYCKPCLAKKNEDFQDKKKKRKKKEKVH